MARQSDDRDALETPPSGQADGTPAGLVRLADDLRLGWYLALNDLKFRYERSLIGPLWIVLQMALFVTTLGVILSEVHGVAVASFMPFFACSLLFWSFLSNSLNEGMESLRLGADLIRDRGVRPLVPVLQTIIRNLLIALYCLPVPLVVTVWFGGTTVGRALGAIPGAILFIVAVTLLTICASTLASRYRDIKRIVETLLMLGFLATPILWQPGLLRDKASYVLALNPLAHLFAVWREPLLEGRWPVSSFAVCAGLIVALAIGVRLSAGHLRRAAFWL